MAIFLLFTAFVGEAQGKAVKTIELTGFIEKDVAGKDYLYLDTGSGVYTLKFRSVFLANQAVLKSKRIPNAQITLKVNQTDIVRVKKTKFKNAGGYR